MKEIRYDLGVISISPPSYQSFLKFVLYFIPFGAFKEVIRVFILMSASSWELRGGPYSFILHNCYRWQLSGGKSRHPSLSGSGDVFVANLRVLQSTRW